MISTLPLQQNLSTEETAMPIVENIRNGMFMIHHIEEPM